MAKLSIYYKISKFFHNYFSIVLYYDMGERALPLFLQFMTFYDTIRYFETLQMPENEQLLCLVVFYCATSHSYQAHQQRAILGLLFF